MNIVVIGSGYVGTTAAAIFSIAGHDVTAIDIDPKKVSLINSGKAPFFEEGLDKLIAESVRRGTLVATSEYKEPVSQADVIFSCVGTPDNPDGSSNLSHVFDVAEKSANYIKKGAVFVQKSTVPVGTGRKIIELLPKGIGYVSNPEFLRESTAIYDTLMFDRIVSGGDNTKANKTVLSIHKSVEERFEDISKVSGINYNSERTGKYIDTRLESAELIKVTSNAFLALKISFANSIAQLSDAAGADINEVMSIVGEDIRIGKAFFNAGRGYGGGCFPKDVSGLISSADDFKVDMPIMEAVSTVNNQMPIYIINQLRNTFGEMKGVRIAILGLAFKSGTSDARRSPAVKLANMLSEEGAIITAYDPQANSEAKPDLNSSINVVNSLEEVLSQARIAVLATDWPEFKPLSLWSRGVDSLEIVVDAVNFLDLKEVRECKLQYIGVGRKL